MHSTLDQPEGRSQAGLPRIERGCAVALVAIAVLTLLAWKWAPSLVALPAAWGLMHPTTALCMLLAAAGILCSGPTAPAWQQRLAQVCAGAMLLVAVITLSSQAGDRHSILQDWFVTGRSGMSLQSAVGVLLLGLLLPLARVYRGSGSLIADVLTLLLSDFVLVMLMGYVYSFSSLFGEAASGIRIPPPSFLCFLICTAVVILHRSGGGVLAVLRGGGIGSRIVRVAIPLALLLPLALSLVRAYVVSQGLLDIAYASAAATSVVCFCVTWLALLMGWRINGLEQEVRNLMQKRSDAQLQESEQRYMQLVEQSISGFVVRRQDGRLILVNEAYRKMTGYSREELLTLSAKDLVVDQSVLERVRGLEPGQSAHIETLLKRKDGSLLEVEYVTQRMPDGNLQSVLLDISQRKQLQKQRDESERRYAELVEQAQEGISVRRPNGAYVFVNETFCQMLGYSRYELMGMSIGQVVHPEDAETTAQVQQLGQGGHLRLQKRMLRKDGSVIHVEVSAKRLRNGDIQSTVQDVTERKRAEQAREESEQRYMDLVEQAADSIWLRNRDGSMVFVNEAACRLLGYTRDELLRSNSSDLLHSTDHETARNIDALQSFETLRVERVMRHKDGHPIPVEASARRLQDGSVQVISHDITERKRIEDELRQLSQRLGEAQETERRAIARELHDEVGQSLTATRINLRDLGQQTSDSPLRQRLSDTEEIIAELLGKVRQMSLDLHPSVLDDLGIIPALRWCVRTRAGGGPMQVLLHVPEDLPRFTDMVELTLFRVFQEALSNTLKHAAATQLDVHLQYSRGRLLLTMKDDGKGFDAKAARREALSGKSLGLLGMQERVRLAGGDIVMDSAPGKGTEVRVSLPGEER